MLSLKRKKLEDAGTVEFCTPADIGSASQRLDNALVCMQWCWSAAAD
jgi:hypothetical protein